MATEIANAYRNFVGDEWVEAVDGENMVEPGYGRDMSMCSLEEYEQINNVMAKID